LIHVTAAAPSFPSPAPDAPAPVPVLVRRLWLDLAGELPPADVVATALATPERIDVDALVARLLASPAFDRHWGRVLRGWLTAGVPGYQPIANRSLARWLAERLAAHTPVDALVRELVSVRGSALDHPAVSYLLQLRESRDDIAGHVARTFLGARIQCAQCHDHPFAPWKKADFHAFADVFAQLRIVQWPVPLLERALTGAPITPDQYLATMPPYVRDGRRDAESDARIRILLERYAEARTAGTPTTDTPTVAALFEKIGVPREQVGELTPRTLAVVLDNRRPEGDRPRFLDGTVPGPELGRRRDALARWITSAPDRRWARCFANRVWKQLTGRGLIEPVDELDRPDDARRAPELDALAARWVASGADLRALVREIVCTQTYRAASAPARPLSPEVLARCVLQATGEVAGPDAAATFEDVLARTLTPVSGVPADVLSPSLQDALFLANGPLNEICARAVPSPVDALFRRTLCRPPTPAEATAFASPATTTSDALWALCTSAEFQEVH
jgi:hypothetical protein